MTSLAEVPLAPADTPTTAVRLAGSRAGLADISSLLAGAVGTSLAHHAPGPLPAGTPAEVLAAASRALGPAALPERGAGDLPALQLLARVMSEYGVNLAHPHAAAHLQPPTLTVAVAADVLAAAGNGSLDTYDSGPAGIAVERWLIGALTRLARLGPDADGVLTPGGSLSNLLGLHLARDAAALRRGVDVRRHGVAALPGPRVLCSEIAHFSVHRACAALGLGEEAVIPVATDRDHRMRPDALADALAALGPDETAIAVVATAGTTDFGTVDPLPAITEIAAHHGVWTHVDAAYGFGTLFSDRLAGRLDGIEAADSVTLDLHKIGWLPAATSVLLVSDPAGFGALDRQVAYLNPADDADAGFDGLLGRSLQTTRRADAVKAAAAFLAHGRAGLGTLVDRCHDLARHAQARIEAEPALELVAGADLTTVVFRYRGADPGADDRLNAALRRSLLETGTALVGRTEVRLPGADPGPAGAPAADAAPRRVCLKFTLLNPTTTTDDIDRLVAAVLAAGRRCDHHARERTA